MSERFYITTAIPYANGAPHIGHAYERIATDAIQRFMRLDGRDVLFVTGMDEHGLKVQQTAARAGVTPQAFVDGVAAEFEAMGELLNARADDIVRTTQPRHARACQAIWERMAANGDIYLSKYAGWYSVRDEAYFEEGELTPGPNGTRLAPSGAQAAWVEEESYFFKLSAYADRLLAHYEAHPDFITPEKYRNEIVAFVKRGLNDLSISRTTFDWGVPVPGDPRHVMYVWVDALTNYITATGFPDDGPARGVLAGGRPRHRQGHHALPRDLLAGVPDVGGPAAAQPGRRPRLSVQPRREDVEVGRQRRQPGRSRRQATGSTPCAISSCAKPLGGRTAIIPTRRSSAASTPISPTISAISRSARCRSSPATAPRSRTPDAAAFTPADLAMLAAADALAGARSREHMRAFQIHLYHRRRRWRRSAAANRYFASAEPWRLAKSDPARMRVVLYVTLETLRIVAILLQPAMPASMAKLLDLLGVAAERTRLRRARAGARRSRRAGAACAGDAAAAAGAGVSRATRRPERACQRRKRRKVRRRARRVDWRRPASGRRGTLG